MATAVDLEPLAVRCGRDSAVRIWVVQDEGSTRTSLELGLSEQGYSIRAEADGCHLRDAVATFRPDLAILDLRLRVGPDGFAITRELRKTSDIGVLMLTAAGSVEERLAGFAAGCDDYLVKPFFMAELQMRIRALLRRTRPTKSQLLHVGDVTLSKAARSVTRAGLPIELTRTEFDLLAAFLARPDQVMSNLQLLAAVGRSEGSCYSLIPVHLASLRRKLELYGPPILHTVRGIGYVLRKPTAVGVRRADRRFAAITGRPVADGTYCGYAPLGWSAPASAAKRPRTAGLPDRRPHPARAG